MKKEELLDSQINGREVCEDEKVNKMSIFMPNIMEKDAIEDVGKGLIGLQEGDGSLPQVSGVLMGLDHVDVALKKLLHGKNSSASKHLLVVLGKSYEARCECDETEHGLLWYHEMGARSNFYEPNGKRGEQNDGESEGDKRDDDE
ncbi:hypothetical protein C5167_039764 [Papaver somniferum]|uniref:Uncharacterized protein n=1 Tax=Papaver somniferum TaxID=3469 RepID=A0A4Y7IH94_PAPSO|nr:hypothetical protein C5167_039764 [Papaver somniferum]